MARCQRCGKEVSENEWGDFEPTDGSRTTDWGPVVCYVSEQPEGKVLHTHRPEEEGNVMAVNSIDAHNVASDDYQGIPAPVVKPPKFKLGDSVRLIANPEWGDLTVTQVDTVYTVVDSKGRDDAWVEAELIATPPPCKHIVGSEILPSAANPDFQWIDYTYCPLCGEKLTPTGTTLSKEGGNQ